MMLCLRCNWFSFEYIRSITMETFISEEAFRKHLISELKEMLSEFQQIDSMQLKHKLPVIPIPV